MTEDITKETEEDSKYKSISKSSFEESKKYNLKNILIFVIDTLFFLNYLKIYYL